MNCDDFLSAFETGDDQQRDEARQHAEDCPICAGTLASLLEIKTALSCRDPLPDSARAVWEKASRVSRPGQRPRYQWAAPLSAAAAIVISFVFFTITHRVRTPAVDAPGISQTVEITINASGNPTEILVHNLAGELTELISATESLDDVLNSMSEQVERLEVEQEIQVTLNHFNRW